MIDGSHVRSERGGDAAGRDHRAAGSADRRAMGASGALGAAVALGTSVFLDGTAEGIPSLVHGVGQAVIRATPGNLAREGIDAVGTADKPLVLAGTVVLSIVLGAVLGVAAGRRRGAYAAGLAAFAAVGWAATTWATTASAGATAVTAVGSALAGLAAFALLRRAAPPVLEAAAAAGGRPPGTDRQDLGGAAGRPSRRAGRSVLGDDQAGPTAWPGAIQLAATRRRFLTTAGLTAVGAGAATLLGRRLQASGAAEAARRDVVLPAASDAAAPVPAGAEAGLDGLSPVVTPNRDFYRIDEALVVPAVDLEGWTLRVTGMVEEPLTLTYDDLLAEDLVERHVTLACVSNEVGGGLVGNARWLGVPLARLLERAGVQDGADQLVGRSVDGFSVGFPTEVALDGRDALVAVGMNGEPLPRDHGFPARLVVPGLYGYVSATKWLKEIELTTWDAFDAYWIERGWAKEGPVKTQSRIDVPRRPQPAGPVTVAGVAWAQHRGISAVEVRIDEGEWQAATLLDAISDDTWRQWHLTWDASPGRHVVEVRATDGDGEVQTPDRSPVFPDGATGLHRIVVEVTEPSP